MSTHPRIRNRLVPLVLTLFASDVSSENKTASGRTTDRKEEIEGEREETSARFSSVLPSVRGSGKERGTEKYQWCVARTSFFPQRESERPKVSLRWNESRVMVGAATDCLGSSSWAHLHDPFYPLSVFKYQPKGRVPRRLTHDTEYIEDQRLKGAC